MALYELLEKEDGSSYGFIEFEGRVPTQSEIDETIRGINDAEWSIDDLVAELRRKGFACKLISVDGSFLI